MTEEKQVRKLSAKEQRFVDEYIIDCNQTQAAIRAGYSPKSARQIAHRLMTKDYIQAAITRAREEWDEQYKHRVMQKYEVLARLTEIARSDMGDLLPTNQNGEPIGDIHGVSLADAKAAGKSHLIKKLKSTIITNGENDTQTEITELELYSAHEALRDLGKHHVLFTDKTEVTGENGGPIVLKVVYEDKHATS